MRHHVLFALPLVALLAACGTAETNTSAAAGADNAQVAGTTGGNDAAMAGGAGVGTVARAAIADAEGQPRGDATATEVEGGVRVTLAVMNMPAGEYGYHVHAVGRCDAPSFESAGPHWNPTGAQHGTENDAGPHMGDLPNLTVGADGTGRLEATIQGATLGAGANSMMDSDGTSILIHERADDYRTDPAGDSGARIACGVLR